MVGGLAALMQLAGSRVSAGRPAGRLDQHHLQGRRERGHREPRHRAHRRLGRRARGHSPDHLGEPERALLGDDRVLGRARPRRRRRRRARPRRAHHGPPARGRRPSGRAQGRFERRRHHVGRRHLLDARCPRADRVPQARLCRPACDRARRRDGLYRRRAALRHADLGRPHGACGARADGARRRDARSRSRTSSCPAGSSPRRSASSPSRPIPGSPAPRNSRRSSFRTRTATSSASAKSPRSRSGPRTTASSSTRTATSRSASASCARRPRTR